MKKNSSLIKITQPQIGNALHRTRLFQWLDDAHNNKIIWVVAPGGYGKTTLISDYISKNNINSIWYQIDERDKDIASFFHYLGLAVFRFTGGRKKLSAFSREYHSSLGVFSRNFFDQIFSNKKYPKILAVDNYHEVGKHAELHEVISHAVEEMPNDCKIIVLSRSVPPAEFSRHIASNQLVLLNKNELKLNREEMKDFLGLKNMTKSPVYQNQNQDQKYFSDLYRKTDGWISGVILLSKYDNKNVNYDNTVTDSLFNYFAHEVFSKTEKNAQKFLMQTSFLENITVDLAAEVCEGKNTKEILKNMDVNNYFIYRYSESNRTFYQYHPLFKEFLVSEAQKNFSFDELEKLKKDTARALEKNQQFEAALSLYAEIQDWDNLIPLIIKIAQQFVDKGQIHTLGKWLKIIPDQIFQSFSWLLFWSGVCQLAYSPYQSRQLFEKAFALFQTEKNDPGMLLAWAYIVDTFEYAWDDFKPLDRWISVMEQILEEMPEYPSEEINVRIAGCMLSAMTNRQPGRSDLPLWANRVQKIVIRSSNFQLKLILGSPLLFYYIWNGDFSNIALVVEALQPAGRLAGYDPLTRQFWYAWKAMYSWFVADWKACWQAISEGLDNAEKSGIHLFDLFLLAQGVFGGLSLGDPHTAISCLEKMALANSPRPGDKALYHYQAASVSWFCGEYRQSIEHGKNSIELCESIGWPMSHALCLIDQSATFFDFGQNNEALRCLEGALQICRGMNGLEFLAYINGARIFFHIGNDKSAFDFLRKAMALGAKQGYMNLPRWNDKTMAELCARAIENNIEVKYVCELIQKRKLNPPYPVTGWPQSSGNIKKPYIQSNLTNMSIDRTLNDLDRLIKIDAVYLDPGLSRKSLAKLLGIKPWQLTEILNTKLKTNFQQFINECRINEVLRIFNEKPEDEAALIRIAFDAGFKSKSVFNENFKNKTGITPTEYRNRLKSVNQP